MAVKIRKVSLTLKSSMAFLPTSLVFLHVMSSLHKSRSALDMDWAVSQGLSNWWLLLLVMFTLRLLKRGSTVALWPYILCNAIVFAQIFMFFLEDLNKLILAFDFLYLLAAFASAALLRIELKESLYIPGFSAHDVEFAFNYNLPVEFEIGDGKTALGQITYCSGESCFIVPQTPLEGPTGSVKIKINYGEKEFQVEGEVHTHFNGGFGVKIMSPTEADMDYSWADFLEVVTDRGLMVKN